MDSRVLLGLIAAFLATPAAAVAFAAAGVVVKLVGGVLTALVGTIVAFKLDFNLDVIRGLRSMLHFINRIAGFVGVGLVFEDKHDDGFFESHVARIVPVIVGNPMNGWLSDRQELVDLSTGETVVD